MWKLQHLSLPDLQLPPPLGFEPRHSGFVRRNIWRSGRAVVILLQEFLDFALCFLQALRGKISSRAGRCLSIVCLMIAQRSTIL